jgi:response regulator RpfG family c-di-GMP phosphodiesterase
MTPTVITAAERPRNGKPLAKTKYVCHGNPIFHRVHGLIEMGVLSADDWHQLAVASQNEVLTTHDDDAFLAKLIGHGLLTEYQRDRLLAGTTHGLVLGNYRVLDRIGAGGMGIVFKAQHSVMRRTVAVKVLPVGRDQDPRLLQRFRAEIRAVAALQHPNIVAATDAGCVVSPDPNLPAMHYLVMEYIEGSDLEHFVQDNGPLPVVTACDLAYQLASALAEAHARGMIHRDVKPSNVLVTGESQAKLLDFGLAHTFADRGLTEPGTHLGTSDYMAPEQAIDASRVDGRTDLYGLGGTLYWCLAGELPFGDDDGSLAALLRRRTAPPPSVKRRRPEVPDGLDAAVARLLAPNADDRFADADSVMRALLPFLRQNGDEAQVTARAEAPAGPTRWRVLIADDSPEVRDYVLMVLNDGAAVYDCAGDGAEALRRFAECPYDAVLMDVYMPGMDGIEALGKLRQLPGGADARVLMMSGQMPQDDMARLMLAGSDDFLIKPFSAQLVRARVQAALRVKQVVGEATHAARQLRGLSLDLEQSLAAREGDLTEVRKALVLSLAATIGLRAHETCGHLVRLQQYCRTVAEAVTGPRGGAGLGPEFIDALESAAPLHDLGAVALPDHILLKPSKLDPDERTVMESHTTIGAEILNRIAKQVGAAAPFMQLAADVARSHHERWDGTGYPDRLAAEAIPLAARILAVGDVYDAMRSRRPYRPALSHETAVQVISHGSEGRFDPAVLDAFRRCAERFRAIFSQNPD